MVGFIIMSHSTRKPSMFDKIMAFFQQNKFVAQSALLAVVVLLSSVFFYKFNSIAVGYSSRMILFLGILSAVLLFLFCLLYKYFLKKESSKTLPRFYLVILLLMGTMYSAVLLPGTAPDEPFHYKSSYYYSNLLTGKTSEDGTLVMRETDIEFENNALNAMMGKESYQATNQALADNSSSNDFVITSINGNTSSLPQTRIFSAIGISLGQLFGLNGAMTFYLGRLFNFLCFALLAFAAYKITPIGKTLFAAITLLPMTLHIANSYSYDATIIGLSLLLIALCLKGIYSEQKCSKKLLIAIPVVTFFLAPCKVLYTLSALLVFLIPNSNFSSKKFAYIYKFGLMGLALFAVCIFKLPELLNMASVPQGNDSVSDGTNNRGVESGYFYSLSFLIEHPGHTAFLFVNTLNQKFDFYLNTFLGGSLGWFQAELKTPWFFILLFLGILFYTARRSDIDSLVPSTKTKTIFGLLSALMFFAVILSLCLAWTFTTEFSIEGVQGRYFLPFAPLIFLLFRTKNTKRNEDSSPIILLSLFALNAMNLIYVWAAMARC